MQFKYNKIQSSALIYPKLKQRKLYSKCVSVCENIRFYSLKVYIFNSLHIVSYFFLQIDNTHGSKDLRID